MSAPDIFVSYNREDRAIARRFAEAFDAEGFEVWWDATLQAGDAYDEVTEAALNSARAVSVLWSPRSVGSRWVRAEATVADRNGTLAPCMIEPCNRPVMFELTQTADLIGWSGDRGAAAWQAYVADVRRLIGRDSPSRAVGNEPKVAGPTPVRDRPGLAIVPLRCGAEHEDFAQGLVDEAATIYNRYKYVLGIVDRPASARYRIEGSLRRAGSLTRLAAQLINVESGAQIWAERLDTSLEDPFAAQEDLAQQLAAQTAQAIESAETRWAMRQRLKDLGAYHRVLVGLQTVRGFTVESEVEAVRILTDAAEDFPMDGYVLSLASLACCLLLTLGGASDAESVKAAGRDFVRRAVQVGGDDPQVLGWAALGGLACGTDIAMLDTLIERALERNPGWSSMWTWNSNVKVYKGDAEVALERAKRAIAMEPRSVDRFVMLTTMGWAYVQLGRYEDAIAPLTEAEQLIAGWPAALAGLLVANVQLGRLEEARKARSALTDSMAEAVIDACRTPQLRTLIREALDKTSG
ncbi:TIR domain-containing protein [Qipengyuania zhejiangensis]|uniref:TIR domain-containing protein n=1 Tax=Qipengyuania zhejiangensis TaxID=3077782 RepID=UPI002D7808DC|nr:TIR domain-containing protein [Qipengyuania sp. Z2]